MSRLNLTRDFSNRRPPDPLIGWRGKYAYQHSPPINNNNVSLATPTLAPLEFHFRLCHYVELEYVGTERA